VSAMSIETAWRSAASHDTPPNTRLKLGYACVSCQRGGGLSSFAQSPDLPGLFIFARSSQMKHELPLAGPMPTALPNWMGDHDVIGGRITSYCIAVPVLVLRLNHLGHF
jgi:hypothetical protein